MAAWNLTQVWDISADGRTIVGYGSSPNTGSQGWVAVVPEPGTAGIALAAVAGMLGSVLRLNGTGRTGADARAPRASPNRILLRASAASSPGTTC